jgi:hypothetical protein
MRGIVVGKSCDVEILQNADCVLITGGKDNGGADGQKG